MERKEEQKLSRDIVRRIAKEMRSRGFLHAKPTFLVRPFDRFAQFIHFHKFSFGPRFRLHLGVRVMNDPFEAVALNGPSFEYAGAFGPGEEQSLACTRMLIALIENEGLPWFSLLCRDEDLILSSKSPLKERDRIALQDDIRGLKCDLHWQQSAALLGVGKENA